MLIMHTASPSVCRIEASPLIANSIMTSTSATVYAETSPIPGRRVIGVHDPAGSRGDGVAGVPAAEARDAVAALVLARTILPPGTPGPLRGGLDDRVDVRAPLASTTISSLGGNHGDGWGASVGTTHGESVRAFEQREGVGGCETPWVVGEAD
jgi:hypothetical protein